MQSPLANLSNVLRIVKQSADNYAPTLKKNEAATRAVLIDPVLRALGWDVTNPFMVEVETPGDFGAKIYADYALKANANVAIVIEAKKLGTNLEQFHHQLVQYGFSFGIERLFLTDGIRWEHFTSLEPGKLAPTKTLDLNLGEFGQIAAYLVQELDAALVSPDEEQIEVLTEQVEQLQQEVAKLKTFEKRLTILEKLQSEEVLEQPESPAVPPTLTLAWQSLEELSSMKGKKPSNFRLPNGEEIAVRNWSQVLIEACRYVLSMNLNLQMPLLDKVGKKTNLIQETPFPSNVNSSQVEVNGHAFYIYVNYDANNAVTNTIHILEQVPNELKETQAAINL